MIGDERDAAALAELRAAVRGLDVDPGRLAEWAGKGAHAVTETGERVEALRKAWGLSQRELARLLGVSNAAVSRWESGESASVPLLDAFLLLVESAPVKARRLLERAQREREE